MQTSTVAIAEEELLRRSDQGCVLAEEGNIGTDSIQRLRDGKQDSFQVEKRYICRNGQLFWARLTLSRLGISKMEFEIQWS